MLHIYAFLLVGLALRSEALSYWLDTSCLGKLTDEVFNEVRSMGSEGGARLRDPNDQVMPSAFQQILMVDKSDANAFGQATKAFDTIAGLTQTLDQLSSDIRIYCDNDNRWTLVPDLPLAGKKSKNSKKDFPYQSFWDAGNFIFRKQGSMGCQDPGIDTLAQTYKNKGAPGPDKGIAAGHNAAREMITICNAAFGLKPLLTNVASDDDLTSVTMDKFDSLVSMTLFHELCHITNVINIPGKEEENNGWDEVTSLTAADAIENADSFAFLGLTAILNARNARLSADTGKAISGLLEWITPPVRPVQKRALKFFS